MLQENQGCSLLSYIHGTIHRKADISGVQGGGVIDPVTEIAHHMTALLEGEDDAVFLGGRDATEQGSRLHARLQSVVIQLGDLCSCEYPCHGEVELCAHVLGDQLVVASHDLDPDPA